jgi:hypothetical protein
MAANRDELDAILEKGIASYPEAEPLAGMEERVVARMGMAKMPQRGVSGWRAVWAVGFATVAITGLVLIQTRQNEPRPVAVAVVSRPRHFEPAPVQISEPRRRPHIARVRRVRALPKGPVFPTPSPLTTEEHLMVALVSRNPDEAAQAFDGLRRRADEPIAATPIVIPPIPVSNEQ